MYGGTPILEDGSELLCDLQIFLTFSDLVGSPFYVQIDFIQGFHGSGKRFFKSQEKVRKFHFEWKFCKKSGKNKSK